MNWKKGSLYTEKNLLSKVCGKNECVAAGI
jgi:hypothetical protein